MKAHLRFELTHRLDQGRPIVQLTDPLVLEALPSFGAQGNITIPAGFRTDFASLPTPVRWFIPVFGRSAKASVLHDWLCYIKYDKKTRSKMFLEQMLHDGVPSWQAYVQWFAVRFWPGSENVSGEIIPPTA